MGKKNYQLLDFGEGRRLERFGQVIVDRPAPMAQGPRADNQLWKSAWLRFDGQWHVDRDPPDNWQLLCGNIALELKTTPAGQLGVFIEQSANWQWIQEHLSRSGVEVPRLLNLFAYTGGSTLSAAAAGAHVVHIDAADTVVRWARKNAQQAGLHDRPVRWICEDARKFAARELRRKQLYEAIVLDPPTYGHGPQGKAWMIDDHLSELLDLCGQLLSPNWQFLLLTCHTERLRSAQLKRMLRSALPVKHDISAKTMSLETEDGRKLDLGVALRCRPQQPVK